MNDEELELMTRVELTAPLSRYMTLTQMVGGALLLLLWAWLMVVLLSAALS